MITKTIAGHEIALLPGVAYIATRPARGPGDVVISRRDNGRIARIVRNLSAEDAAALAEEFNRGTRLDGRMW